MPESAATTRLRITEIFHSLQGESRPAGLATVFVRLTGCPLRCTFCDTAYAFSGGTTMSVDEVLAKMQAWRTRRACVTGGEPLAQKGCSALLERLCDAGWETSLETSGALPLDEVDPRVTIVMDLKTPGSGETSRNLWDNLGRLREGDQIKFVITGRADYEWAVRVIGERELAGHDLLFSPAWGQLPERELAEWILADELPVRLQIQLHKYLWGDAPGH